MFVSSIIKKCIIGLLFLPLVTVADQFSLRPDHLMQPSLLIEAPKRYPNVVIVELSTGIAYIYRRTEKHFVLLASMPVSIGKEGYGKRVEGDNKTPVGVYRITSYLNAEQLDDFYGHGAYPLNYPNVWDKRQGRTGYGIWLHAEPMGLKDKTRPLLDSNGCIVLSNNDIDAISQYIQVAYTYIITSPNVEMVPIKEVIQKREVLLQRLQDWEFAWESRIAEPYLAFYSQDFSNFEKNFKQWSRYKREINGRKAFIKVDISDVSIYEYPSEKGMVWVEYYQTYDSSNFRSEGWKRQLWRLEADGVWRIIYEGGG